MEIKKSEEQRKKILYFFLLQHKKFIKRKGIKRLMTTQSNNFFIFMFTSVFFPSLSLLLHPLTYIIHLFLFFFFGFFFILCNKFSFIFSNSKELKTRKKFENGQEKREKRGRKKSFKEKVFKNLLSIDFSCGKFQVNSVTFLCVVWKRVSQCMLTQFSELFRKLFFLLYSIHTHSLGYNSLHLGSLMLHFDMSSF